MYNTGFEYIREEKQSRDNIFGLIHIVKVKDIDKANKIIFLLKSKGILIIYAQYVKMIDETYHLNQKSIDFIKSIRINKLKRIIDIIG